MKDKIAFAAVGQAGGNIGQLFEARGYAVLYLNTSREDLDTLEGAKHKYHITGGEGCNKDRHKAKQLVIDDFDNIAAEMDSKLDAEMIFVIFSAGGGTGSGAGPMLVDLLLDEGKTIGAVTIVPGPGESVKSQMNAYECFTELTSIEGSGACFIIDNQKGEKLSLNHPFAGDFCSFLDIPEKHKDVKGNIDRAEIMEALRAHGMAVLAASPGKGGSAALLEKLKGGIHAPLEPDRVVKYIAMSGAGDTKAEDVEKAVGVPLDIFQTYNDRDSVCCITGLSYPLTRLEVIYQKVEENRETVVNSLNAAGKAKLRRDVNFLAGLENPVKRAEPEKKGKSRRDIISKYL